MPQTVQIVPYYAQPHVHTVINDNSFYTEDVAAADSSEKPYTALSVIGADKGIDNKFVKLTDYKTKAEIFGKGNFSKYGQPSLQADMLLKNGETNLWLMRVMPDNATYANMIIVANYRIGDVVDSKYQPTGKKRLEIKFTLEHAEKPIITNGATTDSSIEDYALSLNSDTADALTGYKKRVLGWCRSIGRGKYGNNYSLRIERDLDHEYDYSVKMYGFGLIENDVYTTAKNYFVGSIMSTNKYDYSLVVDDVLDRYAEGSCPIKIKTYQNTIDAIFEEYQEVITLNKAYIETSGTDEDKSDLEYAEKITVDVFDPIFGYKLNTRTGDIIPFYQNYTTQGSGYVKPDHTVASNVPNNLSSWSTAFVGAKLLVTSDPDHDNKRWAYNVIEINDSDDIIYDDGAEEAFDAAEYDGIDLSVSVGLMMSGGHDGDFEEISVNGASRKPTSSEMKILLAREYVKAFRGTKDKYILSPSRINLDFIFDANYNLTTINDVSEISIDNTNRGIYSGSTVLTDEDYRELAIVTTDGTMITPDEINVKKAMYDLNQFRNKNGMTLSKEEGAGCELKLDTGLISLKSIEVNMELSNVIDIMSEFDGRNTSIDLGYYQIYDPVSGRKIEVTATYYLAEKLIPHIVKYGPNKPFVNLYAQINGSNVVKNSFKPELDLIDWDVKEKLYLNRINYYVTTEEGKTIQRSTQNTCQKDASSLLEENNVRVLNILKKGLEKACTDYLYEWNDPTVRKGYTDSQMDKYSPWIGNWVEDLVIRFEANEYEQERMIMHCYVEVAFKDLAKRIILEIDINRPDYSGGVAA